MMMSVVWMGEKKLPRDEKCAQLKKLEKAAFDGERRETNQMIFIEINEELLIH